MAIPDASLEDIRQAARAAQADEFIYGFEADYETVIGERGVTLSGGQRQRLALARAFLTDPPILVLDDSTSAIDSATEDRIQRAIYTAARGRTTLMITHRLSQIRWADLILVLRKGRSGGDGDPRRADAHIRGLPEDFSRRMSFFSGLDTEGYDRQYTDRQLTRRIWTYFRSLSGSAHLGGVFHLADCRSRSSDTGAGGAGGRRPEHNRGGRERRFLCSPGRCSWWG